MAESPSTHLLVWRLLQTVVGGDAPTRFVQGLWIRQRHEFGRTRNLRAITWQRGRDTKAPWSLRLLGERPYVYLLDVRGKDVDEAQRLFPEAIINPKATDWPDVPMGPPMLPTPPAN